jgi:excisionase family DNA binding protein
MTSFVEIGEKKFLNVKDASRLSGYSRDYIGRLAREQKITAHQIGRQWFVSMDSLQAYAKSAEQDLRNRQQKLSEERRRERQAVLREERKKVIAKKKKENLRARALAVTVLTLGVGLGVLINTASVDQLSSDGQLASAPQESGLLVVEDEFLIATGEVEESVVSEGIDFSQESMTISTLDGASYGVMLLPEVGGEQLSEEEVKALFSDPVSIERDEKGNRYVVRTASDGTKERLPFAVVPIDKPQTP